jgi:hypothetical protein
VLYCSVRKQMVWLHSSTVPCFPIGTMFLHCHRKQVSCPFFRH